jgi:hypothetical protein
MLRFAPSPAGIADRAATGLPLVFVFRNVDLNQYEICII